MTYQQTLDYLFNSLPMYHRIGQAAYKADITNTVQMMTHLGNPQSQFRSIHVAGTNGKGSVSHMLASVLMQAGYKVGLYTSPHLVDFRERIRINGKMIPEQQVVEFVEHHRPFMQSLQLSFFEMTVALAFHYFANEHVDVAVVEVGMGGRLDSTNVITPSLSIITNIGFDHTQFLGDTLPKIAAEKAGIIKPHVPVVIGETLPETRPVFEQRATELQSPIYFADDHYRIIPIADPSSPTNALNFPMLNFKVESLGGVSRPLLRGMAEGRGMCFNSQFSILNSQFTSPLTGSYQLQNLATLFQSLEQLSLLGYHISLPNIRQGIAQVVDATGLHGRWEQLDNHPLTIIETAHNSDGINAMLRKLSSIPYRQLHLIYGCVNDKDYPSILRMLPRQRTSYYYTQPTVPRALSVDLLVEAAASMGMAGEAFPRVADAIAHARSQADPQHDLVLITGSIFLVADAVGEYQKKRSRV